VIYCYPKLSDRDLLVVRLLGPGLGNLLFPWARALVMSSHAGYQLIAPTWPQLKVGTLLRREPDTRFYSGLFDASPSALTGMRRLVALLARKRIAEHEADSARDGDVIEFSGMKGLFLPILNDHAVVRAGLLEITRPSHQAGLHFDFSNSISLHVRLGDFAAAASQQELLLGKVNLRVPLTWYADMVRGVRDRFGSHIKVYIFSDGSDSELAPLLTMHNCSRLTFGSSIADLLALSRSNLLVASGSTFSMWASYLGRMPVLWHPGQLRCKLYDDSILECEAAAAESLAELSREKIISLGTRFLRVPT
jgi:hypothetical protein